MTKKADKELLDAVLEPRKQGALQTIANACSAGADPNAVCPECSTSTGPVRAGCTLPNHSIHECAANSVKTLLECGADPNLTDQNGWTPWMASTLVDGSKRSRIQEALLQFGANKTGDHIDELTRAIANGDVARTSTLNNQDVLQPSRDPKYHLLYERATASESMSSDDIVEKLMEWDEKYGVSVTDAKGDSLAIEFLSLPNNLDDFYREVLVLCPDAPDNERELLQQSRKSKQLSLWWD